MIKCPKCKSIKLRFAVPTNAYLAYFQDEEGIHPNGGEQTEGTSHFVECDCSECGHSFYMRQSTFYKNPILDE